MNISLVAYTPLVKGFLSGAYEQRPRLNHPEDDRSGRYQFSEEDFRYYQAILELIRRVAAEKDAIPAQISLTWTLNKKPWIAPIPGTRTPSRMRENAGAPEIALTPDELKKLDDALDQMSLIDTASRRTH